MTGPRLDDECEFCRGTAAREAGLPRTANPYPEPPAQLRPRTVDWYETSWALWDTGWIIAQLEDETEQPNR